MQQIEKQSETDERTARRRSTRSPVFIVGAQRSGTTMARLMLDSHPELAIPFESNFIHQYAIKCDEYGDLTRSQNLEKLITDIQAEPFVTRGELSQISVGDIVAEMDEFAFPDVVNAMFTAFAKSRGKSRWGDKTPTSVVHIDLLSHLFPQAVFVHIIRDGRDVAVSRMTTWNNRSVAKIAHDWAWKVATGRKSGHALGDRYFEVKYEDLVREPEKTLKAVCAAIGEEYDPSMLSYHQDAKDRMPEESMRHHQTSVRPPDPKKIGTWKTRMSKGNRAIFQDIAGELLDSLGYEIEDDNAISYRLCRRWAEISHAIRGQMVFASPALKHMDLS